MSEWENFTPAYIHWLVWTALEGEADPGEVKKLLEYYCHLVDEGKSVPKDLEVYFRQGIRAFILGGKPSLDSALGVLRKKHRPKDNPEPKIQVALEVLKAMMDGKNQTSAADHAAKVRHKSKRTVDGIWAAHDMDAYIRLRIENNRQWTDAEINRLTEIFGSKPWFNTTAIASK